jgi:hypothetical protein
VRTGLCAGRPGTQGRPGADWQRNKKIRARAPRPAPLLRHAVRNGALTERDNGGYRLCGGEVKGVRILVDESKRFSARMFAGVRATPMIRIGDRKSSALGACEDGKKFNRESVHYYANVESPNLASQLLVLVVEAAFRATADIPRRC